METMVTKLFGEIGVDEEKVIEFKEGIIGFSDLNRFMLIHDSENEESKITWLQSLDEPAFALPIIEPHFIKEDYNPIVEDELLKSIGEITGDELLVMVTIKVPEDITKMTVNLKAPIVINPNTKKGCQILIDDDDYQIKYPIYDILKARKGGE